MPQVDRKHYDRRLSQLKSERSTWDAHCTEIRDFFAPRDGQFPGEKRRGERTDFEIINEACIFAARVLGNGMVSHVTPRSRPWVRLTTDDPELAEWQPVKIWLRDAERVLHEVFRKARVYGPLGMTFRRMGVFGVGAFGLFESFENIVRAMPYQHGTYYLGGDEDGTVNTFYREYELTAMQMVGEFGRKNVPQEVRAAYDRGDYDTTFPVVHAIEPNTGRDIDRVDNTNMPFRSVYFTPRDREVYLKQSGFEDFPIIAGRWEIAGMGPYGNSPAMDVLGSAKQLQVEELQKSQGIEMELDPPMQLPTALRGVIDKLPGGENYYDEVKGAMGARRLYETRLSIADVREDIREIVSRIQQGMLTDLFLMLDQLEGVQPRNELELLQREQEKFTVLGPVLENTDGDILDPLVNRTFAKVLKHNILPPPPEELQGEDLGIEYISPVHQAMRAVAVGPIQRTTAFVADLKARFPDSTVDDKLDLDQSVDEFADAVGSPPRMIRPDDMVEGIRQERAQAAQAAQMTAQMQQAADGAKTLSETKLDQGSALDALLGG